LLQRFATGNFHEARGMLLYSGEDILQSFPFRRCTNTSYRTRRIAVHILSGEQTRMAYRRETIRPVLRKIFP
jgi:hypothetical protein